MKITWLPRLREIACLDEVLFSTFTRSLAATGLFTWMVVVIIAVEVRSRLALEYAISICIWQ